MASYNEIDGVPSHANKWLLRDVLRKEWGFKGFIVSDYYAIWELGYRPDTHGHFVAKDKKEVVPARGRSGGQHRTARSGLLPASGRTGEERRAEGDRSWMSWSRRCCSGNSRWGCSTIRTSILTRQTAWSAVMSNRATGSEGAREAITLLKNENRLLRST